MRISQYPLVHELENATLILIDGPTGGTKTIQAKDLATELAAMAGTTGGTSSYEELDEWISLEDRGNTFRGKNLGNTYTAAQKAKVADGTFKGFFIGDYWEKDGIKYRIADINYWLGTGDTKCTTPHLVIVPDSGLGSPQKMNDTNTTAKGYAGSKLRGMLGGIVNPYIKSVFGEGTSLLHTELLTNAVSNGYPSGGSWYSSISEIMNEPMVYGSYQLTPGSTGSIMPYRCTNDKTQLALFRLHPEFIVLMNSSGEGETYWLRDVVSSTYFAGVYAKGYSNFNNASSALAVRPVFGIIG